MMMPHVRDGMEARKMDPATHAQVLCAATVVAGADGHIDDLERKVLERLGARLGVGPRSLDALLRQALGDPSYVQKKLTELSAHAADTMKMLFTVAVADGTLMEDELAVLRELSDKIGLPIERFERIHSAAKAFLATRTA